MCESIGLPASGFSVCKESCYCQLIPETFPIDDNVIPGIKAGILNPSGNHSKKGCKASNATNMNVLYIPKERASLLDALGIQQYAIGCNP